MCASVIDREDHVDQLVSLLKDQDEDVRKFAAFAVGNLAFHNDQFYAKVRASGRRAADPPGMRRKAGYNR